MGKKDEIKDNIWEIWKISLNAKRFLKYSHYLHKPDTEEEHEFLRTSRDFQFIAHALWRNAVIELSKLFNESKERDKFNVFHFINKLGKSGHFRDFKIAQAKIDYWQKQIEENRKTIDLITSLRDKVYAHSDGPKEKTGLDTPTFEQTEKLINIIENIIQEIYSTVFDSHAIMDSPNLELHPSKIIKVLAADKKVRIAARKNYLNKSD